MERHICGMTLRNGKILKGVTPKKKIFKFVRKEKMRNPVRPRNNSKPGGKTKSSFGWLELPDGRSIKASCKSNYEKNYYYYYYY